MATVFIFHGAFGHPEENWIPWLKNELESLGHTVFVPRFPTPEHQSLASWKEAFKPYESHWGGDAIAVGHSLGFTFALRLLETLENPIRAVFSVAGFIGPLGNPAFDSINATFTENPFDWQKIRKNGGRFTIFYSDNDPYVPISEGKRLVALLGAEGVLVERAGHFNGQAGYATFDRLLERLKRRGS